MAFEGLSGKLNNVFGKLKGRGKLNEKDIKDAMREVRMALLDADVNYKVAKDFVAKVSEKAVGEKVMDSLTPAQQVIDIVHRELIELMGNTTAKLNFPSKPPCVIMMCGLQGAGKTTHCAKLAKHLIAESPPAAGSMRYLPTRGYRPVENSWRKGRRARVRNGSDRPGEDR